MNKSSLRLLRDTGRTVPLSSVVVSTGFSAAIWAVPSAAEALFPDSGPPTLLGPSLQSRSPFWLQSQRPTHLLDICLGVPQTLGLSMSRDSLTVFPVPNQAPVPISVKNIMTTHFPKPDASGSSQTLTDLGSGPKLRAWSWMDLMRNDEGRKEGKGKEPYARTSPK